jgi:hypothetical protein
MLQRGFYYAAGTVIICAIGSALLQLAVQILSLSSPLADAAAILAAAAVLVNSLRRRMRIAAKHLPARSTNIRGRAGGSPPVDRMAGGDTRRPRFPQAGAPPGRRVLPGRADWRRGRPHQHHRPAAASRAVTAPPRHFKRHTATTPASYARSHTRRVR